MTVTEVNVLIEKAKIRKDGVYSFRGNLWVVKNNNFIAYSNSLGECYQRFGSFVTHIGTVERHERKEKLLTWLKSQ